MDQFYDDLMFFLGLVSGAVVGGIVAVMLTAPMDEQVQPQASTAGLELKDPSPDIVQTAQQAAQQAVARVQIAAQELGSSTRNEGAARA